MAEFRYARTRTSRPIKVTIPGPFTLSGRLTYGRGEVYPDRIAAAQAFVPILAAELEALVAAGATYIQVDEPSPAIHPEASGEFAALLQRGDRRRSRVASGSRRTSASATCSGRPLARRVYRPVLEQALAFRVDELVLEWANREMAELDVAADIAAAGRHLSAGVVDVKSYHVESADEVAERIEQVLAAGVPESGLSLVPDCGFSQTARWATKPKLRALVDGRDLVRGRRSDCRSWPLAGGMPDVEGLARTVRRGRATTKAGPARAGLRCWTREPGEPSHSPPGVTSTTAFSKPSPVTGPRRSRARSRPRGLGEVASPGALARVRPR